jgi:uncharacterized damage-inducible protein DinB
MDLISFFAEQLERECTASRKVLEQVPEGKNSWKPHEKSMEMGYLAALVAQIPAWITMMLETDALDFANPAHMAKFQKEAGSRQALLALGEQSCAGAQAALRAANAERLAEMWSLKMGDKVLNSGPRHQQIGDALTHLAHHRGQLTVYLRLNDAKVPGIYGPSADEKWA